MYSTPASFFQDFLANDNIIRKKADAFIENFVKQSPSTAIDFLLTGLSDEKSEYADLAALLLKKKFVDDVEVLKSLNKNQITKILTTNETLIKSNIKLLTQKRMAEIIVQVYGYQENYQTLLSFISSLSCKKLILYFIETLCDYAFEEELLIQFAPFLTQIFENSIQDQDIQVRVAAMRSMTIFLSYITDESFLKKFTSIFPILISTSIEAIKADEEAGKIALESFNDLIEAHSKFIKPILNELLQLICEIVGAVQLSETLRNTALNMILTLSSDSQSLLRKCPIFKTNLLPLFLQTISQIEDSSSFLEDLQDTTLSLTTVPGTAQDVFAKLVPEIGVKFLLPVYSPLIKIALSTGEWKTIYAGLMVLGSLAEGMKEYYSSEIESVMSMLIPIMDCDHYLVEYSLMTAVALLCTEFTPQLQTKYHMNILPFLLKKMQSPHRKIQLRAVSTLINFSRDLVDQDSTNIFDPYLSTLLPLIQSLLQASVSSICYPLQEELLSLLSNLSLLLPPTSSSSFYQLFMPSLKTLLLSPISSENVQQVNIRALTIECIGYLASSLKDPVLLRTDIESIMVFLINLESTLPNDDPQRQAILGCYLRFAEALGIDFAIYLEKVFPSVIKAAEITVDFSLQDEEKVQIEKKERKIVQASIDLKSLGGKKVLSVNTDALELKIAGVNALKGMVKTLGKSWISAAEKTAEIIGKLLDYKYSKEIRISAFKTIRHLMNVYTNEGDMALILNRFLGGMNKETINLLKLENNEELKTILRLISKSLKPFRSPLIDKVALQILLENCVQTLKFQEKLKNQLLKKFVDEKEDVDEEEKEDLQDDYEEFNDLMQAVMEIVGKILRIYKNEFELYICGSLIPFFYKILGNKESTDNEFLYAICAFDDLLEHGSQEVFDKSYFEIYQMFINILKSTTNLDLIQSIVYGFGIIGLRSNTSSYQNIYIPTIEALLSLINQPDALSPSKAECTECAIGALGRVTLSHPTLLSPPSPLAKFVSLLPLTNESEEAQNIHILLIKETLKGNEGLKGLGEEVVRGKLKEIWDLDRTKGELEILGDEGRKLYGELFN